MVLHLNTNVNGSVGMCVEAADWLRKLATRAYAAADKGHLARTTAQGGWIGPASSAFQIEIGKTTRFSDDLAHTCERYESALLDFAAAMEKVLSRMVNALEKAGSGGLEVHGPIILRPEHPGPEPSMGPQYVPADGVPGAVDQYRRDREAYADRVADFNRKAGVYNVCRDIVSDARNREKEAHIALVEVLESDQGFEINGWTIGRTTVSALIEFIGSAENKRQESLLRANQFAEQSRSFQVLAEGRLPPEWTAKQRMQFMAAAAKAGVGEASYRQRVTELDRVLKRSPEKARDWLAAYPGKGKLDPTGAGADLGTGRRAAKHTLAKLPYIGSALVAGNELIGAATGEQTWGKAVAKTAGVLGGSGAVSWAGAAACAPLAPPWGSLVCGTGGAILGGIGGGEVVDYFNPGDEDVDFPDPVTEMYYPGAEGRSDDRIGQ